MRYFKPLLWIQIVLSFATFVTLVVAPALIPASFGVTVNKDAYPVCYFYAAAEFSLAVLSLLTLGIENAKALKAICANFSAYHAMSAALGLFAISRGAPAALIANVIPHAIVALGMAYFIATGTKRPRPKGAYAA